MKVKYYIAVKDDRIIHKERTLTAISKAIGVTPSMICHRRNKSLSDKTINDYKVYVIEEEVV